MVYLFWQQKANACGTLLVGQLKTCSRTESQGRGQRLASLLPADAASMDDAVSEADRTPVVTKTADRSDHRK